MKHYTTLKQTKEDKKQPIGPLAHKEHKEKTFCVPLMPSTMGINLLMPLSQKRNSTCYRRIHVKGNTSSDNISPGRGYHSNQCIGSSID
jgi:hypothetical protein